MISREAPAVMNLLKALSLLASDALIRTPVANSDVQSHTKMELTPAHAIKRLQDLHEQVHVEVFRRLDKAFERVPPQAL
jgi:hypothetical protein